MSTFDWTRYGHERECSGMHYATEITTTCAEHPHMDRVDIHIHCHRQRVQMILDREMSDGSHLVIAVTGCRPVDQPLLEVP